MNSYATLAQLKSALNQTGTTLDAQLSVSLEAASRAVDNVAGREFYTVTETRYFDSVVPARVLVDDVLAVTAVATDVEGDRSYSEAWTTSDYELWPANSYPKTILAAKPTGAYLFGYDKPLYVSVTGTFGYGDGESATPWTATADEVSLASATATAMTFSGHAATITAGHTILVGTEQIYVTSVSTGATNDTAVVVRGVNGTAGAIHSTAATSIATYPAIVTQAVLWYGSMIWNQAVSAGYSQQRIGEYSYQIASANSVNDALTRYLAGVTRRSAG